MLNRLREVFPHDDKRSVVSAFSRFLVRMAETEASSAAREPPLTRLGEKHSECSPKWVRHGFAGPRVKSPENLPLRDKSSISAAWEEVTGTYLKFLSVHRKVMDENGH